MHHVLTENLQPVGRNARKTVEPTKGIVDRIVDQGRLWRVKYMGTFWFARPYPSKEILTIHPGEVVDVLGRSGISLIVTPTQAEALRVEV